MATVDKIRDARAHDRCTAELEVSLVVGGQEIPARSRDLGVGGMFIMSDMQLNYGDTCAVRMTLPALKESVELPVTVRWVTDEGAGVQFGSLRAREMWAINKLVREHEEVSGVRAVIK